jgi:hypothetical protein
MAAPKQVTREDLVEAFTTSQRRAYDLFDSKDIPYMVSLLKAFGFEDEAEWLQMPENHQAYLLYLTSPATDRAKYLPEISRW